MLLLNHLSEFELSNMTESQLLAMEISVQHFTAELFELLTYGLRNPTGVWRDFQSAYDYHKHLLNCLGLKINLAHLPAAPRVEDYSIDFTSPATPGFPKRVPT